MQCSAQEAPDVTCSLLGDARLITWPILVSSRALLNEFTISLHVTNRYFSKDMLRSGWHAASHQKPSHQPQHPLRTLATINQHRQMMTYYVYQWFLFVLGLTACGILPPKQESNPCPFHWKHRVLTTGPSGKSPINLI